MSVQSRPLSLYVWPCTEPHGSRAPTPSYDRFCPVVRLVILLRELVHLRSCWPAGRSEISVKVDHHGLSSVD